MLNSIPIFGWLLALFFNISLAVPFYLCWHSFGIGRDYFDFLPQKYQDIGFWATVGVFTVLSILRRFGPTLSSSTSTAEVKKES